MLCTSTAALNLVFKEAARKGKLIDDALNFVQRVSAVMRESPINRKL